MSTSQGADEIRSDQPQVHSDANAGTPPRHRSRSGGLRAIFNRSRQNSPHDQGGIGPSNQDHREDDEERRSISSLGSGLEPGAMTQEQKTHLEYTRTHPMGSILMNIYKDSLAIAEKAGVHEMSCSLPELCKNFYSTMHIEQDTMRKNLKETAEKLQTDMIYREINSHMMQVDFPAPTHFSPHPTLKFPSQRGEAMRVFPVKGKKFSGVNEAGSPGIIEFLSNMNGAQTQCLLSESEFIEFLLLCTTGYAHSLLIDWVNQGENIPTLYHNLLTFFDKRVSPDEAREALLKIKAAKYSNLNKLMAKILSLAGRASSVLPPGEAQKAYFNSEAINALLHSLPPTSSALARNQLILLSAKLAGPVSFNVLCKSLNMFKNQIDEDIKRNGIESERKNVKYGGKPQKWNNGKKYTEQITSYAIDAPTTIGGNSGNYRGDQGRFVRGNNPPQPAFQRQGNYQSRNQGQNGSGHFQRGSNHRGNSRKSWGNRQGHQGQNVNYCSLCGHKDHRASEGCPYMVADNGKPIATLPMLGTCTVCPSHVNPKLHHPVPLCPFRANGPLFGSK